MPRCCFPLACSLTLILNALAVACNIPVFRYALERWQPDNLELTVYHDGQLDEQGLTSATNEDLGVGAAGSVDEVASGNESAPQAHLAESHSTADEWHARLRGLKQQPANLSLNLVDLSSSSSPTARQLLSEVDAGQQPEIPYMILRGRHPRGLFTCWQGSLDDAKDLASSPVREELARKLLAGDSIVWLIILSENPDKNRPVLDLLKSTGETLSDEIDLPEGIGLPGSELFSDVPLFLRFSTLAIERSDARESLLLGIAKGFQPEAYDTDEPLVIPVFGRGRALEVIPSSRLSAALVRDITMFLCGACSCQVKDQNPGFDLLISLDWEKELYGEDSPLPPSADSIRPGARQGQAPVLLTIPPGRSKKS